MKTILKFRGRKACRDNNQGETGMKSWLRIDFI